MKTQLFFSALLAGLVVTGTAFAQDPRERNYYYEILKPQHEPKPLVEGFAQSKVKECLNRGLSVAPAADGKGIYLSWRMLETDNAQARFDVYPGPNGMTVMAIWCAGTGIRSAWLSWTGRLPVSWHAGERIN